MSLQVKRYSGDGIIYDCSSSPPIVGMLFSWPGYRIEFPKFRSDSPYEAVYHFSHVPQLTGYRAPIIYLRFKPGNRIAAERNKELVSSVFHFSLLDSTHNMLHSAEIPMATSIWTDWGGAFGVYDLGKSELHFEARKSYVLKVSYTPGPTPPPARELYFSIEYGCSK
jgi:hypothetical protein